MKPVLKLMHPNFDLAAELSIIDVPYGKWPHFLEWAIADDPGEIAYAWQASATVVATALLEKLA